MQKARKKLSLLVLAVLLMQLFTPLSSAFASSSLAAPTNLRYFQDGVDNILLRWDGVTGAQAYRVYELKGEEKVLLSQTTNLYRYLPAITEGTHVYAVAAVNSMGESPLSQSLTVTIQYPTMQSPIGFTAAIVNGNDVSLKWNSTEFATSYKVYEVKNGVRELLTTTSKTNQYFTNVSEGERFYEVTSNHAQYGESVPSSALLNVVYPEMPAPSGLTAYINDINNVLLRWQAVPYAEVYNVYKLVDGQRQLLHSTTDTKQYITSLPEGANTFEVTSFNSKYGETIEGSKATVNIVYPEMVPPDQVYSYFYNGNDLLIMWSAVAYADHYKLYQVKEGQRELLTTTLNRSYYLSNLPEGDYTFEIVASSERFGEGLAKPYNVTVEFPEMQPPKATLMKDTTTSAIIGWSVVPYATEYEVYKLINGLPELIATTKKTSHYVSGLEQGKHEYAVIAVSDRFGKSGFSNIVVAEVNPVLSAPVASEPEVSGNEVTLSWDTVEEASTYNIYKLVDGEPVLVGTTTDTSYTVEELEEGSHQYIIAPVTEDGTESIATATITVEIEQPSDVTSPVTTAIAIEEWTNTDVVVDLEAADDLSGVKATYYSVNYGPYVAGNELTISEQGVYTISYYSEDHAGNVEMVKTLEVKIDKEAPTTTANTSTSWYNQPVNVTLTAEDNLSGVKATYYSVNNSAFVEGVEFSLTEQGVHTVSFYSVDNVGNVEEVKTVQVKIDKEPPTTTANTNDSWYNQEVVVQLTAEDHLSGVHATYYSINGSEFVEGTTFVVETEGVNTITVYSVDKAGNVEAAKTVEVKVDKTKPVTESNLEDKWYTEAVAVELTATDNLSGVKATYYSINGAEFAEGTNFVLDAEGIHVVNYYSVDFAGNVEDTQTVEVKIDKTAPEITEGFASEYALGSELKLAYEATDNLSGIKDSFVEVNGVVNTTGELALDKPGEYTITITAIDHAGLKTVIEKTIVVYIEASLEVLPRVIKGNKGVFTVKATLPKGYSFAAVDLSTAKLNGVFALDSSKGLENQAKKGQFKFNRDDFVWDEREEFLELRVMVNGYLVVGSTTVKVIK